MRRLIKSLFAVLAFLAFAGLLSATVQPASIADEEADDEDNSPSFYAKAPNIPTATQIQVLLLKHRGL